MNEFGFNIKTSKDFFYKLIEDYKDFCTDKTSARIAINCSMTSFHLIEWIYNEYETSLSSKFKGRKDFETYIKSECPSIQIMHDIANGTKHYKLDRHIPKIKDTDLHMGGYSREYSRDYDVSILKIILVDGSKIYFEDELEKVVLFWTKYFENINESN